MLVINLQLHRQHHTEKYLDPSLEATLFAYNWPGNVRELHFYFLFVFAHCFQKRILMQLLLYQLLQRWGG